jgi:hypothetical protein
MQYEDDTSEEDSCHYSPRVYRQAEPTWHLRRVEGPSLFGSSSRVVAIDYDLHFFRPVHTGLPVVEVEYDEELHAPLQLTMFPSYVLIKDGCMSVLHDIPTRQTVRTLLSMTDDPALL